MRNPFRRRKPTKKERLTEALVRFVEMLTDTKRK